MDNKEFEKIVDEQLKYCKELLIDKSKEYDFGEDRLYSFKAAGKLLKSSPEEALIGYWTKHVMSIIDMSKCAENFDYEKWTEKITDCINYMLLLKGIIFESKVNQKK